MVKGSDGEGDGEGDGEVSRPRALRADDLDDDPDFVAFWDAYPKRTDKGHARKAWLAKVIRKHTDPGIVLAAAKAYADRVANSDPNFIAYPATWLNGERWLDEVPNPPEPGDHRNAWMTGDF